MAIEHDIAWTENLCFGDAGTAIDIPLNSGYDGSNLFLVDVSEYVVDVNVLAVHGIRSTTNATQRSCPMLEPRHNNW